MELCAGCCTRAVLVIIVLSGYIVLDVSSERILNLKAQELLPSHKTITGQLGVLRQCRRQLTFIASAGLGSFITRIIKDSPLTPLPLPPLEDPPRWNFLTLPLQLSAPYVKWMQGYMGEPQQFYKDYLPPPMNLFEDPSNFIDAAGWRRPPRYRRNALVSVKPSPLFVAKAVTKALKHLHSVFLQHKGTIKWLMRFCQ